MIFENYTPNGVVVEEDMTNEKPFNELKQRYK